MSQSQIIDSVPMALFVVAGFVANRGVGMIADRVADYVADRLPAGTGLTKKMVDVVVRATFFLLALYATNQLFVTVPSVLPVGMLGITPQQAAAAFATQAAVLGGSMPGLNTSLDEVFVALFPGM